MSKIKCIIIEDEPLAAKVLSEYISDVPYLELKGKFKDAILAAEYIQSNNIDLIFLDIHLPKLKGMAFLKTLTGKPFVIITTAYHQYAVEGFELDVTDYLLKPIEFERFLTAVNRVKALHSMNNETNEISENRDSIFVNVHKKKVRILYSDLLYIESQREYVKIVTSKKNYLTKISTQDIEKLLPSVLFKRIHRSFIVSVKKIESYNSDTVEINGVTIPIGREYRGKIENL